MPNRLDRMIDRHGNHNRSKCNAVPSVTEGKCVLMYSPAFSLRVLQTPAFSSNHQDNLSPPPEEASLPAVEYYTYHRNWKACSLQTPPCLPCWDVNALNALHFWNCTSDVCQFPWRDPRLCDRVIFPWDVLSPRGKWNVITETNTLWVSPAERVVGDLNRDLSRSLVAMSLAVIIALLVAGPLRLPPVDSSTQAAMQRLVRESLPAGLEPRGILSSLAPLTFFRQ